MRLALVLAVAALLWARSASADDNKQRALEHFQQAEAYMKTEAYGLAIEEYRAAYELVPKAGFLFNIGFAYEKWGKAEQALQHYDKYLKLEPKGRASTEARARAAGLRQKVDAERKARAQQEREQARVQERTQKAAALAAQAAAAVKAGSWQQARDRYESAFELTENANYVFNIAEVYRAEGDKAQAIVEYERYRLLAPAGDHSAKALRRIVALKRELETGTAQPQQEPPQDKQPQSTSEQQPDLVVADPIVGGDDGMPSTHAVVEPGATADHGKSGVGWTWVAVGAAAVAGGLAADLGPSSASNGKVDVMDFLPVALYAAGAGFVWAGVF